MKIRPNMIRTTIIFLFSFLALELLFWILYVVDFTNGEYLPTKVDEYVPLILLAVFSVLFFAYSISRSYYLVEKKNLYQYRLTKELQYAYDDIIYINETWTIKHKTLLFITDKGKTIYMMMDRKGILLTEVKSRCKNLLTEEDFKRKYPNIRF